MSAPRLFIASSVEGLDIAYALQENLEYDCDPTVWSQGVFKPSSVALTDLIAEATQSDFAVFTFTPDDILEMRGASFGAVRDNVIFEYGLFIGALGKGRCFHLVPRNQPDLRMPSDLIGIVPLSYNDKRADGRLIAALGPAANQIRHSIRFLGSRRTARETVEKNQKTERSPPDFQALWDSEPIVASRSIVRLGLVDQYDDIYAAQKPHVERLFAFLESMADSVLSGEVPEETMRRKFCEPVLSFWPAASVFLAPLNDAQEWWNPTPRLAELYRKWLGSRPSNKS
jgi:hypothetical protein